MDLTCRWTFALVGPINDEQQQLLLSIMDDLLTLEDSTDYLTDSALGLNLAKHSIEISVVAKADTYEECVASSMSAIRQAIDASGAALSGLLAPETSEQNSAVFEPADSLSAIA